MIPPIPVAAPNDDVGDGFPTLDGDTTQTAAWRERERRQRSVRLLMMFLLMLLLMDGEEQSSNRRRNDPLLRNKRKNQLKKGTVLDDVVFEARRDQDERLWQVTSRHSRFQSLLELNGNVNHEIQVRTWANDIAVQQQHDKEGEVVAQEAKKLFDLQDEQDVWHYPWNSTGFYRGEWIRAEDDEQENPDEDPKAAADEESKSNNNVQYLSTMDLEGPMKERMTAMKEKVGVYLLPRGTKSHMSNYNATKADQATAEALAAARKSRALDIATPWMRMTQPELNEVLATAEDENETPPTLTLTKGQGRAAFQFYSRSVPSMKEMSLVDGFVKLYDSNTVGYSTRRDILLRVRGVVIHSIGRISLVSNAAPGRSALVISDDVETESTTTTELPTNNNESPVVVGTSTEEEVTEQKRRRLSELVDNVDADSGQEQFEQIRDHVLDLYEFDAMDDDDGDWEVMQSMDPDMPMFSRLENSNSWRDITDRMSRWFWDPKEEEADEKEAPPSAIKTHRRLNELAENQTTPVTEKRATGKKRAPINATLSSSGINSTLAAKRNAELQTKTKKQVAESGDNDAEVTAEERSKLVTPYPYVFDDKLESVRKMKTPAARRMPPREQLLEANAGRCEFEINLDVKEVEWSLGEWKTLMDHHVVAANKLDPKLHKKDPEDREEDEEDEGASLPHTMKRKHADSMPGRSDRAIAKQMQDQALVMAMSGSIHSPNCDFTSSLNATAIRTDWEHTTGKAINYSFYMMLTCLTQIVVLLRQLLHTQHQSTATRVSLLCIGWQTVLDALLCLGHIYLSLAMQPLFTAFASVAFFKLLIFCVIEMKYMAIIIQARNNANGGQSTTELLRRQVAMLHLRFYVALVTAFLAFFYAGQQYRTLYMLALYSFWIPQIIQNIVTEAKRPLHHYYIYGMSVTRCVAPLYMFAVKDNFLKEVYPESPTNYFMVEMLILWVGIQTAILIAQGKYGARFMIPARFLPPKFDYHRAVPASLLPDEPERDSDSDRSPSPPKLKSETTPEPRNRLTGTRNRLKSGRSPPTTTTMTTESETPPASAMDCVICCNGINHHNRKGYMLAPCLHIFHKDCLIQW
eukprot:CAMPEP_0119015812 /NCGR_PEP_ID=MMETSP1176-20130426/11666_1 /TAXON_ID=265551 /ORGANISM="Synedropsis recta cf, Strain CCMP1620" /LENGTH=1087 /DNA_ID=CAMNT_0006969133 /DNA_START=277 /DNA_END=3537 /DNA_ORIENTATION=+